MARLQWSDLRTLPFMILLVAIFVLCLFLAALQASHGPFLELLPPTLVELDPADLRTLPVFIVLFGFFLLSLFLTCLSRRNNPSRLDSRTILLVYEHDKPKRLDVNGVHVAIEQQKCVICLCEFQEKETIRLLPGCNHCFHAVCLESWLVYSRFSCPLCWKPIEQMLPQRQQQHRTTAEQQPDSAELQQQRKMEPDASQDSVKDTEQGLPSMLSELHIDILD